MLDPKVKHLYHSSLMNQKINLINHIGLTFYHYKENNYHQFVQNKFHHLHYKMSFSQFLHKDYHLHFLLSQKKSE